MNRKTVGQVGIVAGIAILAASIFVYNLLSSMKEPPKRKAAEKTVREVETLEVRNTDIEANLELQGTLVAYNKINLFAEVNGVLEESSRPFKVGTYFPKGSVLIKVDKEEAEYSLLSQKSNLLNAITQMMPDLKIDYPQSFSQWKTYLDSFDLNGSIKAFPEPVDEQEKFFIASRNLYSQYFTIKSAENRLDKYVLTAPFSGVLTVVNINPGALVRAGQSLGELMNTGAYELEATIPLSDLEYIKVGNQVALYSEDIEGEWFGKVKRISNQIDPSTQSVRVFIEVSGQNLREGMYLTGAARAATIEEAFALPRDLLVDQNLVYQVQDSLLRLREVEVIKITDQSVIVRGLPEGTKLLKEPIPGAFDGMTVKINGPAQLGAAQ